MTESLKGKKIVLGVTGGIAAFKSVELLRLMVKADASVFVVMSENAKKFVTPLTFEALSENPVYHQIFDGDNSANMEHISVAEKADLFIIAPATANSIAQMAQGLADNPVSNLFLAYSGPVLVAPAMNETMWGNAAVQSNIHTLRNRGIKIIEPESGVLACGVVGQGRLAEPSHMFEEIQKYFSTNRDLGGKSILITAGPTREPIDPVRFITNASSGKMGYALAIEAKARGANVTLISGPTNLESPAGVKVLRCQKAEEMKNLVLDNFSNCNILVMTAAVGDYSLLEISKEKIKKEFGKPLDLNLVPTIDILQEVAKVKNHQYVVGFAAESQNLIENAKEKLKKKNLDMIVANDISFPGVGFNSDNNRVSIINTHGNIESVPMMPKTEIAKIVWDRISSQLEK